MRVPGGLESRWITGCSTLTFSRGTSQSSTRARPFPAATEPSRPRQRESALNLRAGSTFGHPTSQTRLARSHFTPPRLSRAESCQGPATTSAPGETEGQIKLPCPGGYSPSRGSRRRFGTVFRSGADFGRKTASETETRPLGARCFLLKA